MQIANATQVGVGKDKYSIGFKGRWPYCVNGTEPSTCEFDETAKDTIRYIRDTMGVQHASFWCVATPWYRRHCSSLYDCTGIRVLSQVESLLGLLS